MRVRIVDKESRAIVVDVVDAETTSEAAGMLADFMREDVYFTGEQHPHNDAVRRLLLDRREKAAAALEEAQRELWAFEAGTPLP